MAFTRIHHVGIVTPDLDNARKVLVDGFGLAVDEHRTPSPGGDPGYENTSILEFPIGEMRYEVAKPNSEDSAPGQFLASTGGRGGMYYISLASDNFDVDVKMLVDKGVKLRGSIDGQQSVFLEPESVLGLGIQIMAEDNYYTHPHYLGNGNLTGMAHVGVAARSAQESRHLWSDIFGFSEDKSAERGQEGPDPNREKGAADDPVHLLEYPVGGSVIEISHPTTEDSGTARLVAQRATHGAVYHHTCPYAPDVHRFTDQAVENGVIQIGSIPPKGETETVVAWFHPRSCLGMLLEVWNRAPGGEHHHHRAR